MESNLTEFMHKPGDIFNDNVTKNKIYRHLNDINDVISEDDIRNIKVAIPGSENILFRSVGKAEKHLTPWDIIDA